MNPLADLRRWGKLIGQAKAWRPVMSSASTGAMWNRHAILVALGVMVLLISLAGCGSGAAPPAAPETDSRLAEARRRMVEEQIKAPGRGVTNIRVLEAMATVPRHEFVPADLRRAAYGDYPLPIGYDQTISQPFIVAYMTEQLALQPSDRVLEIGTGSGYQAAVLSKLVAEVWTIEIIEPLARRAEADLQRLGYTNVMVKAGDGYQGWPEAAPFDAVIVTCAPEKIPQPLIDQLKDGGRMMIPVGPRWDQSLYLLEKRGKEVKKKAVLPVRFVPMTGKSQEGIK